MTSTTETFEDYPDWALSAAFNGDTSGLTLTDLAALREWEARNGVTGYLTDDEESASCFTRSPQFGLSAATRNVTATVDPAKERPDATATVLRTFPDGGDAIAIFPNDAWGPGRLTSYQVVGQHGECHPDLIGELQKLEPTDARAVDLLRDLKAVGYDVLLIEAEG